MKKMVPRGKMSRKTRRALDEMKRVTWGFTPVTRKVESTKRYRRADKAARNEWAARGSDVT
ncbi:MAG: hypothetical protein PHP02_02600 [Eubacteriales bacterium]|nr:hypothetical protein [Eubacteriales bacterium]